MIVNSQKDKKYKFFKSFVFFTKELLADFKRYKITAKLVNDSKELEKYFRANYPQLALDDKGANRCTSCMICVEKCPTDALEIKKANMVNFPKSFVQGESPKDFLLDISKCIKCQDCILLCPTNALNIGSHEVTHQQEIINLVNEN